MFVTIWLELAESYVDKRKISKLKEWRRSKLFEYGKLIVCASQFSLTGLVSTTTTTTSYNGYEKQAPSYMAHTGLLPASSSRNPHTSNSI